MKKIIIAVVAFTALFATISVSAQTTDAKTKKGIFHKKEKSGKAGKDISSNSLDQFKVDFPGATIVKTAKVSGLDKITFTLSGIKSDAYYDMQSSLVGVVIIKTVSDLQPATAKNISKKYAGYTIQQVILFDDNEANDSDMFLYGTQFADADNYFIELTNDGKTIVLQVTMAGDILFFKAL